MFELFAGVRGWWAVSAVGGGLVLLIAALWMRRTPSHRHRQRLGEIGLVAALFVGVMRLAPAWITIPDPLPASPCAVAAATPVTEETPEPMLLAYSGAESYDGTIRDVGPFAVAPVQVTGVPCTPASESSWRDVAPRWLDGLALGYLVIATGFLARWLLGNWALARIVRQASPAPAPIDASFRQIAHDLGRPETRLSVSSRVGVPLCCGIFQPTVVVPRSLILKNDPAELRWVFAHELTHLARRDPWSVLLLGLGQAVFFYLPWFWWLKRQVRLSQEYVADAAAAAQGRWADEYAEFLVTFARCPAAPMAAAGVFGSTSDLYRRVAMVLQPNRGGESRRQLLGGVGCLVAAAVLVAGLGVRAEAQPGSDDSKKEPVAGKAEKSIEVRVLVDDDDKNKGDDKKEVKKRVMVRELAPLAQVPGFDKAEFEKKLRKALEAAKLDDAEMERIMKEAMKGLESAKKVQMMWESAEPRMGTFVFEGKEGVPAAPPMPGMAGMRVGGMRPTGRLGVMIERPNPALVEQLDLGKDQGLVIIEVIKGGAAEKAGLKAHDVLLRFGDQEITSDLQKFVKMLDECAADKELTAVVLRKGKKEKVEGIKLGEKKEMKIKAVTVAPASAEIAPGQHMIVEAVPAEKFMERAKKSAASNKGEKVTNKAVSVMIKDGEITAKEVDGDVTIVITGSVEGEKVSVKSVTIDEQGSKSTYTSVDKIPSKYKSRVEKLISNSGDSPIRFNSRKE